MFPGPMSSVFLQADGTLVKSHHSNPLNSLADIFSVQKIRDSIHSISNNFGSNWFSLRAGGKNDMDGEFLKV